jgi:predicted nucleic acid-binding protein
MKQQVYIETTIPSFYFETRLDAEAAARCEWTKEWWHSRSALFDIRTSVAVQAELARIPRQEKREQCLQFIALIPKLQIDNEVAAIAQVYIRNKIMPSDAKGDALHLAVASYHECYFLLTWNCTHIANANKFDHIERINTALGLKTPLLITPLELLGEL